MADGKESDIEYSGPNLKYKPPIGDNAQLAGEFIVNPEAFNTYADLDSLRERLNTLNSRTQIMQDTMERVMDTLALVVTDDDEDTDLRQAQTSTWPEGMGDPEKFISYRYYKILKGSQTTASNYIKRRYEEAARDLSGDTAFDLLQLVEVMKKESSLITEFINQNVGNLNDSSEYRTVEIFQDWVDTALSHTKVVSSILLEKDSTTKLPEMPASSLSPEEARKSQALFKVKLNSLNGEIASYLDFLQRNFSDYAGVFYEKFLGPALEFRLKVNRYMYPVSGAINQDLQTTSGALDTNLSVLQADQLRRLKIFDDKMEELESLIRVRNQYRGYIKELAVVGKQIPQGTPGSMVPALTHPTVLDAVKNGQSNDRSLFKSSHSMLSGREAVDAHPQYLLSSGGHITGDITMEPGSRIDGMSPAMHSHNGRDGSSQLTGLAIVPGTLGADAVDIGDRPSSPSGFKLSEETLRMLSDVGVYNAGLYDVKFEWEGEAGLTYEIHIAKVEP